MQDPPLQWNMLLTTAAATSFDHNRICSVAIEFIAEEMDASLIILTFQLLQLSLS